MFQILPAQMHELCTFHPLCQYEPMYHFRSIYFISYSTFISQISLFAFVISLFCKKSFYSHDIKYSQKSIFQLRLNIYFSLIIYLLLFLLNLFTFIGKLRKLWHDDATGDTMERTNLNVWAASRQKNFAAKKFRLSIGHVG